MRFDVLTLFPGIFEGFLGESLLRRAIDLGLLEVRLHDVRDFARDKHHSVDDRPFGGGPGMVLKPEPVVECVEAVRRQADDAGHLVMLTPQGSRLDQPAVERLAQNGRILMLCGRYEGFDERIRTILEPEEISIGDYVLNGGEVAAMVLIESVGRMVHGVLGDEDSNADDSFSGQCRLLEYAQYTRPREYRGLEVPEVLVSGNHEQIAKWRQQDRLDRTRRRRADLLDGP